MMDGVSRYLDQFLTPRLQNLGVSQPFLLHTLSVIDAQMRSLLRHWEDRAFRNTVLLLGQEEGSFYEPPSKTEIRCFVVVTIRNSPVETLQSEAYGRGGLREGLSDQAVRELTSEAIRYFSKQDFGALCRQAQRDDRRDVYQELAVGHPVTWAALQCVAGMRGKTADYPRIAAAPYCLREVEEADTVSVAEPSAASVYDGFSAEIDPQLKAYLKMLAEDDHGALVVDSLKSLTRNVEKLFAILEFLLTRERVFASTNYYLEHGHVERRIQPLRAGHTTREMQANLANTAGLGYRHRAVLRQVEG